MKFFYDQSTDSLYIDLAPQQSAESEEIAPDVIADFDDAGKIVGLDIQNASKTLDLKNVSFSGFIPKLESQLSL